jgi:hypothetical protein
VSKNEKLLTGFIVFCGSAIIVFAYEQLRFAVPAILADVVITAVGLVGIFAPIVPALVSIVTASAKTKDRWSSFTVMSLIAFMFLPTFKKFVAEFFTHFTWMWTKDMSYIALYPAYFWMLFLTSIILMKNWDWPEEPTA